VCSRRCSTWFHLADVSADDLTRQFLGDHLGPLNTDFIIRDGHLLFAVGKHKEDSIFEHDGYLRWMLTANFSEGTNRIVNLALEHLERHDGNSASARENEATFVDQLQQR